MDEKKVLELIKAISQENIKPTIPIPEKKKNLSRISLSDKKINDNEITFYVKSYDENKKIFSKFKKKKPLAYILYWDKSNKMELFDIYDYKQQINIKEKAYHWLNKSIATFNNKPVFWIYRDNIITVDKLETKNEKYITLFSPLSWYNIFNNVVTYKLTGGNANDLKSLIGKYWKYLLVGLIAIVGYLIQSGTISVK